MVQAPREFDKTAVPVPYQYQCGVRLRSQCCWMVWRCNMPTPVEISARLASSDGLRPGTCAKCGKSPTQSFSSWRTLTEEHARADYSLDYSAAVANALGTEFQEPEVCFSCRQVSAKLGKGKPGRKGVKRKRPEPSEAEEDVSAPCPQCEECTEPADFRIWKLEVCV